MVGDLMNNLQIKLLECPDSLINFALSKKFDQHLSLPRSGRRIWEELEYQRIITGQSVVQLLAESTTAVEGQKVIGNPIGLMGTVSDGIISALRENHSLIQITAPMDQATAERVAQLIKDRVTVPGSRDTTEVEVFELLRGRAAGPPSCRRCSDPTQRRSTKSTSRSGSRRSRRPLTHSQTCWVRADRNPVCSTHWSDFAARKSCNLLALTGSKRSDLFDGNAWGSGS